MLHHHLPELMRHEHAKSPQQERPTKATDGGIPKSHGEVVSSGDPACKDEEEAAKATDQEKVFHRTGLKG
jgi:hypothetical protein